MKQLLSIIIPRLCIGLLLLASAGCGRTAPQKIVELPVFFTCDTQGRLEPCGCFVGQFGGLTRMKTVLDGEPRGVRVDIGDAIGGTEDFDLIQYRYMLQAFAAMGFEALNLGHREIRLSAARLQDLQRISKTPLISANVVSIETGKPVVEPYRIVERDGVRIGLIGVVDASGLQEPGSGLRVDPMKSALRRLLPEVQAKSDLLVLLAFADEGAMAELAKEFYEVQIILGGKVRQPAQQLRRENRSLIYFVTNEARALGILKLRLSPGQAPEVIENRIMLLHDRILQDEAMRALAGAYREEIRRTQLEIDNPETLGNDEVPGLRATAEFVGSEQCVGCHPGAAETWRKSGHSRAFATLVERGADADPKCIRCHTIGFGERSGYRRSPGAERLANVGCESCHGPGSLHVRRHRGEINIDFRFRPLDGGDCKKCHYGEFSRPFHWETFWPPIQHGEEPAQPSR